MFALFRVALRNVIRNRRRSILSLCAVFLAVGIMVTVRGMVNGLHDSVRDQVVRGQTGAIQIHRRGYLKSVQGAALELDVPADEAFLARIAAVPGVKAATPRVLFGGMANANDQTVVALLFALDPLRELQVCPARKDMVTAGHMLHRDAPTGADLSSELMHRIGSPQGATVALLANDRDGSLNAVEIKVAGELGDGGMPMPDKKIALIPLAVAQELLRMPGRGTEIAVAVHDLERIDAIIPLIASAVGPEYEVSSWRQVAGFVDQIIEIEDFAFEVIAGIFLGIALLGVANTMLMSVLERTREIGTMMALGLKRRKIVTLFLAEAALLGLCGSTLGACVGVAIMLYYRAAGMTISAVGSQATMHMHPYVTANFVLTMFGLAASGAVVAALYPAWRASRLRPIEALTRT